ncbi:hypothetical protein PRZ48_002142 [Zasmidium cellare]|uniref:Rhodopsin domain-containing protein n=1 Tax=Zasmidium cellare TaxID=395010 RepID=A0ABR0F372_ZASCE|nr:hypothetical protein PRZ48_002142 [Zasmidium cellare]
MPGNLQSIPPSVIASWPTPNYNDPARRPWMPAYAGILQGIMTLMLATRLVLRAQLKAGPLGLDDALLIPSFLGATTFTVLIILGTEKYGMDRHIWDVRASTFENTALIGWAAEIAFITSTCCTKVSVLLFFRRLTQGTFNKIWKYATLAAIAFTISYGVAFILILIFNCTPTAAYWKSYSPAWSTTHTYHCTDTQILNPIQGALSVITDFYSVILPMGMLRTLSTTKRQKWALNAVFSLGLLVVVAGIVRTVYLERLGSHWDITWLGFDVFVWSQLEVQLAIICASAPALRVFFRRYLSDPITRAINSGRSTTGGRSGNRDSKMGDMVGMVVLGRRRQGDVMEVCEEGEGITKRVDVSVEDAIEESPSPSASFSTMNHEARLVKSLEDYENLALETLHRQRKSQPYIDWRGKGS